MTYVSAAEKQEIDPVSQNHQKLDTTVQTLTTKLTDLNKDRTPTTDATIEKAGDSFVIKPEVNGNTIDVDAAVKQLKSAVNSGKDTIELTEFKEKPKVTSEDSSLKEQLASMNAIANVKATYSINGETFQIPSSDIMSWLTYNDGKVDLDTEQVRQYVTDLGTKYNTSTNDTKFKSTKRGEVTVPVGTYSWTIQTDSETEALKKRFWQAKILLVHPLCKVAQPLIIHRSKIRISKLIWRTSICGITKTEKWPLKQISFPESQLHLHLLESSMFGIKKKMQL